MRYQIFKIGLFIASLLPAIALTVGAINDELGANPIEVLTRDTGEWALRFLLITLAVSPMVVIRLAFLSRC